MPLSWLAVDATGTIVCDLPGLTPDGQPLRRTIGRAETSTFTLQLDTTTDPSWVIGTRPMAAALIGYSGDPGSERVEWGGIVTQRIRSLDGSVKLSAATPCGYLDRRYTRAYSVTGRDQNLIVTDLVARAAAGDDRVPGSTGWPFLTTVTGAAGMARDRTYTDDQDKTIYSALTDLAGVIGGPQWMTGWTWSHAPERIRPVVTVGTRIGTPVTAGLAPAVVLTEDDLIDLTVTESYASGAGANLVTASSSGAGDARPQQSAGTAQAGRPVVEHRYTPSTSILDLSTLLGHARGALATMLDGAQTVALTVARASAPRIGIDWDLGDDIGVQIARSSIYPAGVRFTGQCIGYDITDDTITPYLASTTGLVL